MSFAAVAIVGGAAIVGGMGASGYFGNKSSKRAARAQREAAYQYRLAQGRALKYQKPYEAGGRTGFNALTGLLTGQQADAKGNLTTLNEQDRANLFQKSPGYQFRLESAQNALQASQAARGGLFSGGAMKEMNKYTQGIASDEYGNYINQLSGLAGMGQNAANNMSQIEVGGAAPLAGFAQQEGMAYANRDAQMGNMIGGGLQQIGGQLLGGGLSGMSGGGKTGGGMGGGGMGQSNFSSAGGGQYNNSVFSGANMPNTNLQMTGRF